MPAKTNPCLSFSFFCFFFIIIFFKIKAPEKIQVSVSREIVNLSFIAFFGFGSLTFKEAGANRVDVRVVSQINFIRRRGKMDLRRLCIGLAIFIIALPYQLTLTASFVTLARPEILSDISHQFQHPNLALLFGVECFENRENPLPL